MVVTVTKSDREQGLAFSHDMAPLWCVIPTGLRRTGRDENKDKQQNNSIPQIDLSMSGIAMHCLH